MDVYSLQTSAHDQVVKWVSGCIQQQIQMEGVELERTVKTDLYHRVSWYHLYKTAAGTKHWNPDYGET